MQFLPMLQVLQISECGELTYFRKNGFGLENLAHLQQLEISSCPQLVSLEEDKEQGHPCNLQYLRIEHCDKLEKLPNVWQYLTCLEELEIKDCPNLMSFPEMGFPPMLRRLSIQNCEALKSLPDGMMRRRNINDTNTMCLLQYLRIDNCPSLICFPKGQLPNGALARSTLLKHSALAAYFQKQPPFLMITATVPPVSSSQNSHRSSHKKIPQSLSVFDLQALTSLEWLIIEMCPMLQSFLPSGGLPDTLSRLFIWNYLLLKQRYSEKNGEDWPKIAHIPYLSIW